MSTWAGMIVFDLVTHLIVYLHILHALYRTQFVLPYLERIGLKIYEIVVVPVISGICSVKHPLLA